jgi:DNA-binding NarL/FixJ family response regulator
MNNSSVKVVVVSSHPLVGQSVAHVLRDSQSLDIQHVYCDQIDPFEERSADVLLCVFQPGVAPEDVSAQLHLVSDQFTDAAVACFFLSTNDSVLFAALNAGATGLIEETLLEGSLDPSLVEDCLVRVARGEFVASHAVALRLARLQSSAARSTSYAVKSRQLTPRENEVLDLLATGKSNREIASVLSVSEHTIRSHMRGLMQKLEVSNRIQAAASVWRGQTRL